MKKPIKICLLILSVLISNVSFAEESKTDAIKNKTCELYLLDSQRSGTLYPYIEDVLKSKGYTVKHAFVETFDKNIFPTLDQGALWAIGSTYCELQIYRDDILGRLGISANEKYCSAQMLIDQKIENQFITISYPNGMDQGYFHVSPKVAIKKLIKNIPQCVVEQK